MPSKPKHPCSQPGCVQLIETGRYCKTHQNPSSRMSRACRWPGCPELIKEGRYCPSHQKQAEAEYDRRRGSSSERGYDENWQRLRKMFLFENPICADPFHTHAPGFVSSEEVHHVRALRDGGTNSWGNLQALCHSCHSRVTAKENKFYVGKG
jgi:5-methylcytosine-specific restriction enzyme A